MLKSQFRETEIFLFSIFQPRRIDFLVWRLITARITEENWTLLKRKKKIKKKIQDWVEYYFDNLYRLNKKKYGRDIESYEAEEVDEKPEKFFLPRWERRMA